MPHSCQHLIHRWVALSLACLAVTVPVHHCRRTTANNAANNAANTERRLSDADRYLASDELEGRGLGTKGIDLAAEYIADQFAEAGLKTQLYDGTPFQKFNMVTGTDLGEPNRAALVGPAADGQPKKIELKLDKDFTPMAIGGSGKLDLPLVFVGYGITGRDEEYDDYAGLERRRQGRDRAPARAAADQSAQQVQRHEGLAAGHLHPQGVERLRARRGGRDLLHRRARNPQARRPAAASGGKTQSTN